MTKNFTVKLRFYPSEDQESILHAWFGGLRFLWNSALAQRKARLKEWRNGYFSESGKFVKYESEKGTVTLRHQSGRFITCSTKDYYLKNQGRELIADQSKQLTQAQELNVLSWLSTINRRAKQEVLNDLEKAYTSFFNHPNAGEPKFKKHFECPRIYISGARSEEDRWYKISGKRKFRTIEFDEPQYKKFGPLKIIVSRQKKYSLDFLVNKNAIGSWSIIKESNEYYICGAVSLEVNEPAPVNGELIGIDRGINCKTADSNGRTVIWNPNASLEKRITRVQRQLSKAHNKSNKVEDILDNKNQGKNRAKLVVKLAKLKKLQARQLQHINQVESKFYADNYGVIAIEDLKLKNMTASARGTIETPGKNVNAKAGLNREMLARGHGAFALMLENKVKDNGGKFIKVNPAYTSQTCPKCGCIDPNNRDGIKFKCITCNYENHADIVGAIKIRDKAIETMKNPISILPTNKKKTYARGRKPKGSSATVKSTDKKTLEVTASKESVDRVIPEVTKELYVNSGDINTIGIEKT